MGRIILVDDNPTTLKRWESLLLPLGHEVLSYLGAEAALQTLKIHPSHLLVLDLAMPIHSGYDLMQTLKSEGIFIPVLVVSGKSHQADISKALTMGAVDYVLKPFDDDIFLAKVENILKSQQSSNESANPFAESLFSEASSFQVHVPKLAISEMGFKFQSHFLIPRGQFLNFSSACFSEMGIKDTKFRVTSVTENPSGHEFKYNVFVSFVGLSLSQLKEVRLWVRQNQLKNKKAA